MFNLLEKLRTKSRAQRTFVAFSVSLLCVGVVFVVWLTTERNTEKTPESAPVAQNSISNTPTDTVLKNIQDMWGSVMGLSTELSQTIKDVNFSGTIEYTQ